MCKIKFYVLSQVFTQNTQHSLWKKSKEQIESIFDVEKLKFLLPASLRAIKRERQYI